MNSMAPAAMDEPAGVASPAAPRPMPEMAPTQPPPSCQARHLALDLCDHLFARSSAFRTLLISSLDDFLSLTIGHRPERPLPGPPAQAAALRASALAALQRWTALHARAHPQLQLATRYLRDCARLRFPDPVQVEAARAAEEAAARAAREREQLLVRFHELAAAFDARAAGMEALLAQVAACMQLITEAGGAVTQAERQQRERQQREQREQQERQERQGNEEQEQGRRQEQRGELRQKAGQQGEQLQNGEQPQKQRQPQLQQGGQQQEQRRSPAVRQGTHERRAGSGGAGASGAPGADSDDEWEDVGVGGGGGGGDGDVDGGYDVTLLMEDFGGAGGLAGYVPEDDPT